jgi:uncharacterized protein (DUF427 family)
MTEELVTLETAKMLKEKGMFTDIEFPPQSVAQKWLRETKNIHICVYNCACGYGYEISKADNGICDECSLQNECDDSSEIICDIAYENPNMDQCFVSRGKVTDIKIDKEE